MQHLRKVPVSGVAGHRRLPPLHGAELALRHVEQRLLLRHHSGHAADLGNSHIHQDNHIRTHLQGTFLRHAMYVYYHDHLQQVLYVKLRSLVQDEIWSLEDI